MRRGLTLIELVLTIALAGILGIPLGLILGAHLYTALRTRDSNIAVQLARAELEQIDSANDFFDGDLAIGSQAFPNYQGYAYTLTRTVSCQLGNCTSNSISSQGVKRVEVVVSRSDSTDPLARLVTYRTKCVCFGSTPVARNRCDNAVCG